MVTEAGKELLRNTINTAKFHNRILEENEMWKQWELERGLTMMVSDDVILSKSKRHHQCSKHRKRSKSNSWERQEPVNRDVNSAGSSKEVVDRWDHNGYRELYPDETDSGIYNSPARKDNGKKWDHSGFLELYPEEAHKDRSTHSVSKEQPKSKQKKRKRKHQSSASTSDTEIWEEFRVFKRNKAAKKSKSRSYDSHTKEWKKREKERSPV